MEVVLDTKSHSSVIDPYPEVMNSNSDYDKHDISPTTKCRTWCLQNQKTIEMELSLHPNPHQKQQHHVFSVNSNNPFPLNPWDSSPSHSRQSSHSSLDTVDDVSMTTAKVEVLTHQREANDDDDELCMTPAKRPIHNDNILNQNSFNDNTYTARNSNTNSSNNNNNNNNIINVKKSNNCFYNTSINNDNSDATDNNNNNNAESYNRPQTSTSKRNNFLQVPSPQKHRINTHNFSQYNSTNIRCQDNFPLTTNIQNGWHDFQNQSPRNYTEAPQRAKTTHQEHDNTYEVCIPKISVEPYERETLSSIYSHHLYYSPASVAESSQDSYSVRTDYSTSNSILQQLQQQQTTLFPPLPTPPPCLPKLIPSSPKSPTTAATRTPIERVPLCSNKRPNHKMSKSHTSLLHTENESFLVETCFDRTNSNSIMTVNIADTQDYENPVKSKIQIQEETGFLRRKSEMKNYRFSSEKFRRVKRQKACRTILAVICIGMSVISFATSCYILVYIMRSNPLQQQQQQQQQQQSQQLQQQPQQQIRNKVITVPCGVLRHVKGNNTNSTAVKETTQSSGPSGDEPITMCQTPLRRMHSNAGGHPAFAKHVYLEVTKHAFEDNEPVEFTRLARQTKHNGDGNDENDDRHSLAVNKTGIYFVYFGIHLVYEYTTRCRWLEQKTASTYLVKTDPKGIDHGLVRNEHTCCESCRTEKTTEFAGGLFRLEKNSRIHVEVSEPSLVETGKNTFVGYFLVDTSFDLPEDVIFST